MNVTKNVDTLIHIHNALPLMERTVGTLYITQVTISHK